MSRFIAICCCLLTLAFLPWPALAQVIPSPDAPGGTGISDEPTGTSNATTNTGNSDYPGYTEGTTISDEPYVKKATNIPAGLDVVAYGEAIMKAEREKVAESLNRSAEESIYFQRGVALDFLNKPIKLFELTCSAQDGSGSMRVQLPSVVKYAIKQWRNFCKGAAKSGGFKGAVKCAADQIWQAASETAQREFQKYMETGFCRAFTDFINNQVGQCITLRFNVPRGQFPGFPALNQCAFGRLGLTASIGSDGKTTVKANGQIVNDAVSINSFKYSQINGEYSSSGFGGKEDQLLGDDGASALLDQARWGNTVSSGTIAGSSCSSLDPQLVAAFSEFYNRGDGLPANSGTYLNPGNEAVKAWKPNPSANGGAEWRTIANWSKSSDPNGNELITFVPSTASDAVTSWSVKSKYTYIASCYGFEMYPAPAICGTPGTSQAWNEQNCTNLDSEYICCDPDKTDCLGSGIVLAADTCSDGSAPKTITVNGKPSSQYCGLDPKVTLRKAGEASLCAGTCCNPALNDCAAIGSEVCEAYKTVSQCVAVSPEMLAMFDPVYSKLRPKPNMYLTGPAGGQVCCATEWCNLCPQDLLWAANTSGGTGSYRDFYIKNSELANVPAYCKSPRSQGGNILNDQASGLGLIPVSDQVFENTQEACELMKQPDDPWDYNTIKHIFLECAKKQKQGNWANFFLDPLGIDDKISDGIVTVVQGTSDCPESATTKPFIQDIVKLGPSMGCPMLADITRYPAPITKIPRIEGQDPVGLCSELDLCSASVPEGENPRGDTKTSLGGIRELLTNPLSAGGGLTTGSGGQTSGGGSLTSGSSGGGLTTGGGGLTSGSGLNTNGLNTNGLNTGNNNLTTGSGGLNTEGLTDRLKDKDTGDGEGTGRNIIKVPEGKLF
ncbi:MAG TPA: hypothetical protein VGF14_06860 [Alphaproteobacteria bacterium]